MGSKASKAKADNALISLRAFNNDDSDLGARQDIAPPGKIIVHAAGKRELGAVLGHDRSSVKGG